jgi:hypothetical protein
LPAGATPIRHWSFSTGVTPGWAVEGVRSNPGAGVTTVATTGDLGAQLTVPTVPLPPGSYAVVIRGRPTHGGIGIQVFDQTSQQWLAAAYFWSGQDGLVRNPPMVAFTLAKAARVQAYVSNWARTPRISVWRVRRIEYDRVPAP